MNTLQAQTAYIGSTEIKQVRLGNELVLAPNGDQLWYKANTVPSLDLRFADNKSLVDATTGQNLVTFTRASSGTYVDSEGVIQIASTDEPRFDHDPTTGESLGLLVEEQMANLLLNSATLSTQSATVTATSTTLSFYGTGTVTLTGVSTAGPLVGTGASNRVSLTFTPTAGSLTLTVSGSVTNAQLEAGSFPTSYIPTTGAEATRAADVASISGSNFSYWYRQDEGTVFADCLGVNNISGATRRYLEVSNGTTAERFVVGYSSSTNGRFLVIDNGSAVADVNVPSALSPKVAATYAFNDFQLAANGTLGTPDGAATLPTVDRIILGSQDSSIANTFLNGTIRRLTYWAARLPDSTLQTITQ